MVLVAAYSNRWCLNYDKANITQGIWVLTLIIDCCCCFPLGRVQLSVTPLTTTPQASCPSSSPVVCSNSCPLGQWRYPTISSSVIPFSFCLPSLPASRSFLMSQLFTSGGQIIGTSTSASAFPTHIQGWFPLGLTGLISLLYKGLSRGFSKTTVQKHQFFGSQPSLWSNSHIHTWLLGKPYFDYMDICWQSDVSAF